MSIWLTGDIHGNPIRLAPDCFYEQNEFSREKENNTVIICGDFGVVWSKEEIRTEKEKLDWLESRPFTTVFVDGNHDNHKRLATYPIKEWNGGKVHEIRPHVLHLIRGEVYVIEGKKFFCFGGASSHDISDGIIPEENWKEKASELEKQGKYMYRVKDVSWWEEELPTEDEMDNGWENLKKHDYEVDYIITHSPPASVIALLGFGLYEQDVLTRYLEEIRAKTKFHKHFMGHMHVNRVLNEKDILLYEQIIRIVLKTL